MEYIFGIVEKIVYHNEENGFTVIRLKEPRKTELTTVVGKLGLVQAGESIRCNGSFKIAAAHGLQFQSETFETKAPSDLIGIEKYLASGLIHGIGPKFAKRIVALFGTNTLTILDTHPEALYDVPGIGEKKIASIKACWEAQKAIRSIMLFLQTHDVSPAYAQRIYKIYGNETIERIEQNPFTLAEQIPGIGFKRADAIAEKMGFSKTSELRVDSGILFLLGELAASGHVCFPKETLIEKGTSLLGISSDLIEKRLIHLATNEKITIAMLDQKPFVWIKRLYIAERGIAKELLRIRQSLSCMRTVDVVKAVSWAEEQLKLSLAKTQQEAVKKALHEKVLIITGGPGTGKSTITNAILTVTRTLTRKIILCAPTGRAAKRMSEITHTKAQTIHALLQYDFKLRGFRKNHETPLEADLIIIDEASMIDTSLMYHLLKAIASHTRVIFVGDIHQLPSVGPGNVLKEMIESERLAVTTLNEIFRQAKGSRIITNAHLINQGLFPDVSLDKQSDFFFLKAEEAEEVSAKIQELVTTRIPKRYHLNPIDDIQVLCPMKKGPIGTESLNALLSQALNPNKEALFKHGTRYALHDKVMQIRNNYQKEVFNGDIGRIVAIDTLDQEITVKFDHKMVCYNLSDLEELVLAYATSIHKFQGSEAPCIVMPIHTAHFVMLERKLLYTGVTRGRRLVMLVGTIKALSMALERNQAHTRHTGLLSALQEERN